MYQSKEIMLSTTREVDVRTKSYLPQILANIDHVLESSHFNVEKVDSTFITKVEGKVRDIYVFEDVVVLVTTDRLSAFDRQIASIPLKGILLNKISNWWFQQTCHIVPNHIVQEIDERSTLCRRCKVFPIEFVMRGYLTGSTATSIWKNYEAGIREYCGHLLPDNLHKNQKLSNAILTPTTKSVEHDELLSVSDIIARGIMTAEDMNICQNYAHQLFAYGQQICEPRGLILVDTKYEFGKDSAGNIILVDEIHTPDSSRFWLSDSYSSRIVEGKVTIYF